MKKTGYKRRLWNDGERRRKQMRTRGAKRQQDEDDEREGASEGGCFFLKGGRGGENGMSLKRPVLQDTTQTK